MARKNAKKEIEESKKVEDKKDQLKRQTTEKAEKEMKKAGVISTEKKTVTIVKEDGTVVTGIATVPTTKTGCCNVF